MIPRNSATPSCRRRESQRAVSTAVRSISEAGSVSHASAPATAVDAVVAAKPELRSWRRTFTASPMLRTCTSQCAASWRLQSAKPPAVAVAGGQREAHRHRTASQQLIDANRDERSCACSGVCAAYRGVSPSHPFVAACNTQRRGPRSRGSFLFLKRSASWRALYM